MDERRFDQIVRALSGITSRRQAVKSLAGVATALAELGFAEADAKDGKRGKRRPRPSALQDRPDPVADRADATAADDPSPQQAGRSRKRRGNHAGSDRITPAAEPGNCPDRVCHCPPGNTQNCHSTGDGEGHAGHALDCCCGDADCDCESGSACCKPQSTGCANDSQCCDNLQCTGTNRQCGGVSGDVAGICCRKGQVCFQNACCTPMKRREACQGKCGAVDDGCGGTVECGDCAPQDCKIASCGADNICQYDNQPEDTPCGRRRRRQRGRRQRNVCCGGVCTDVDTLCGGTCDSACTADEQCCGATCLPNDQCCTQDSPGCSSGQVCCAGMCEQCCDPSDCPTPPVCQTATCDNGVCGTTNQSDGARCDESGACCNGSCCDNGSVCFQNACCTPTTTCPANACGTISDGCGGTVECPACPAQTCKTASCGANNACQYTNAPDNTSCGDGQACCSGACVAIDSEQNCGRCGNQCPAGTTCSGGQCACGEGFRQCGDSCIPDDRCCTQGSEGCPTGQVCCGGTCEQCCGPDDCPPPPICQTNTCTEGTCDTTNAPDGASCGDGNVCCGGECVNEQTDNQNCGDCGNLCPEGTTCQGGACGAPCAGSGESCADAACCSPLLCGADQICHECAPAGGDCSIAACCNAVAFTCNKNHVCVRPDRGGGGGGGGGADCAHVGRPEHGKPCCPRLHLQKGRCVINRWDHCDPGNQGHASFCEHGTVCAGGRLSPHGTPVCVPKGYRRRKRRAGQTANGDPGVTPAEPVS